MTAFPPTPEPDKGIEITDTEKRGDPMTIPPAAVIALRALRSIVNEDPADRVLRDWQVEAHEYLDRLDALLARIEPQDCGLSANDIYHVMLAWEQQPASDEQTRIVTGLGKLREQFIQLGDSPYVTVPATARVEPPPQEQIPIELPQVAPYGRMSLAELPDYLDCLCEEMDKYESTRYLFMQERSGLEAWAKSLRAAVLAAHRAPPTQEPTE